MQFLVEDLSCSHCAGVITKAVMAAEPNAVVSVDIPAKTVRIESAVSTRIMENVITEAGYTPVLQHA